MGGVSVGLDVARENLYDGALMNGDMASFFIVHYIPYALLPSNWSKRNKVYFANSDLYPMVSRKCRNNLLQGEEMTVEKVKELFLSRKGTIPSYLQKLMEAELSVIPIFWENHWMLGLLQMYAPKKVVSNADFKSVFQICEKILGTKLRDRCLPCVIALSPSRANTVLCSGGLAARAVDW
nr:unnamed protein product [Haemonchus contortus]